MKNSVDVFNQKVGLIFDYNQNTPLFVRMAFIEIERNNLDKAIEILNNGMDKFSDHPVAFFLLAKANTLKGNYQKAAQLIKKGSEIISSPKTFEFYSREIESIRKQREIFKSIRWESTEAHPDYAYASQADRHKKILSVQGDKSFEETLNRLTKDIEGASNTIKEAKKKLEQSKAAGYDTQIVSETLAKIYANQGELQEAISVYEKLIKKNPGKKDYFGLKISELKSRLNAEQS